LREASAAVIRPLFHYTNIITNMAEMMFLANIFKSKQSKPLNISEVYNELKELSSEEK